MAPNKGRVLLAVFTALFIVAAGCTDFTKFSNIPVTVYVTVVDSEGTPIPNSLVRLSGPETIGPIATDANGVATFDAVPRGNYNAAVAAPGGRFGGAEFPIWGGKSFSATIKAEINETGGVDINASPGWTEIINDHTFHIYADSNDIDGSSDSFRFQYWVIPTDVILEARVVDVENHREWTKAGVMIRESLTHNSKYMAALLTGNNGVQSLWRTQDGQGAGQTYTGSGNGHNYPYYVRIERKGNLFTTYYSADGENWVQHQQHEINMGSTVYVGLAVSAHPSNPSGVLAKFDNVRLIPSL